MSKKLLSRLCIGMLFLALLSSCGEKKRQATIAPSKSSSIQHATGFTIEQSGDLTTIHVSSPWPGAETGFTYALVARDKLPSITLPHDAYDAIVATPVQNMVITSTTHIPALEALGVLDVISGFPNTDLISSASARKH